MYKSALVTGGAGFIGERLVRRLAAICQSIVVYDSLLPQVHGEAAAEPLMPDRAVFVHGDIRDRARFSRLVFDASPDLIVHLAAETGTGQSYDEVARYCDVNVSGTAHLAEAIRALPRTGSRRRVVLASSRAVYGEGAYFDAAGNIAVPRPRSVDDLAQGRFAPAGADGAPLRPTATNELVPPSPGSVYASTKLMQEFVLSQSLDGTDTDVLCLRLQNVYGPGQSLRNPYTGVLTIFCGLILKRKQLRIFEDGEITRDFVHVDDVVEALAAAAEAPMPPSGPVNIGSGMPTTILAAAQKLLDLFGLPEPPKITGEFRPGDIRHALADIGKAERELGWRPRIDIDLGLADLAAWVKTAPTFSSRRVEAPR